MAHDQRASIERLSGTRRSRRASPDSECSPNFPSAATTRRTTIKYRLFFLEHAMPLLYSLFTIPADQVTVIVHFGSSLPPPPPTPSPTLLLYFPFRNLIRPISKEEDHFLQDGIKLIFAQFESLFSTKQNRRGKQRILFVFSTVIL